MNNKMGQKTVDRNEVIKFLADVLKISLIRDYCPNGLQVEGKSRISSVVSGVTASLALIEAAIELNADTLLVHHGYFWRNENECITGPKQKRIKKLLTHDINLLAYHLPLDCHPELGNNVQLAKLLNFGTTGRFGENELGWLGKAADPEIVTVANLAKLIETKLGRKPLVIGNPAKKLGNIGWCSGAAQDLLPAAAQAGATAYLSGEISERTVHEALEYDIAYLACGHHATERFGIQALGNLLEEQFGIAHTYVEIDNPV
ncbi:YbgI/family dinuclear metal center protein [Oxalobacter formigenes HOxBLS]|uniref:YbgI/family dinuclear metal center protein n=2 Tax=Oxalobacter paraformigenes TaxID=556268 RepID=C3X650_9BURK|nr:Nif3-like dinuclear metal center hexameric protein [Oxalobacter paraformigenes]EEO28687.2 YbgI/family dinuclear metal center protein [Oxalobacter paraformigenes]